MNRAELFNLIKKKNSFLCVGLDTDRKKIPVHLLKEKDPVFEFNKQIIDATIDFAVAYKPNLAFYECLGPRGLESMQRTLEYLPKNVFTIADAKRGDIGNTSDMYARTFFDYYKFDAVTVAPYMGEDSVKSFLSHEGKWAIVLALTSNKGSVDFQLKLIYAAGQAEKRIPLYVEVINKIKSFGTADNLMFVVGATQAEMLKEIRKNIPDHFLLIPGVGAQGGSLSDVAKYGMNKSCGLLVNSSRNILYAGNSYDFATKAAAEAKKMQQEMEKLLNIYL
jgi:orotidine-5'-phosphate decarboxylase